jgi:ABC-type phosphate transport system substrate-binding protein
MFNITDSPLGNKTTAPQFGVALAAAFLLIEPSAFAADCATGPGVIYGLGGSATKPLLGKVAAALAAQASPRTIVYQAPGACVGINGLIGNTLISGSASYWDTAGKEQSCTIPAPGVPIDFANMGNSATSCPGVSALPADIGDFTGPVNAYTLIAPKASPEISISREAAYFAFGFGDQSQAAPWTDHNYIFVRDQNSAAQLFISLATGVPAQKFQGVDTKSNSGTITAVGQAKKPEAAIGLVSGEVADASRDTVKILAYQHTGQRCGFWPDSTATSFDKRSVRNGQYWIWAPIHFFAKVDTQQKIVKPAVAEFVGLFTGATTLPNVDMLAIETKSGNVPKCAMNVWRDGDLGEIRKQPAAEPCGCAFEKLATGANTCTACETDAQCGASAPKCRFGFCEAK